MEPVSTPGTVFGLTEAQIADFFSTWGVGAFILFMLFIIGEIAWKSKAGKTFDARLVPDRQYGIGLSFDDLNRKKK